MNKMKMQLMAGYIGENIGGGFYLKLAELYEGNSALVKRLRTTAGDEIRHGEFFNQYHNKLFGKKYQSKKMLIRIGKALGYISKVVPQNKLLRMLSKIEGVAVVSLEKELASMSRNPYLDILEKILPDEKNHAEPYRDLI